MGLGIEVGSGSGLVLGFSVGAGEGRGLCGKERFRLVHRCIPIGQVGVFPYTSS